MRSLYLLILTPLLFSSQPLAANPLLFADVNVVDVASKEIRENVDVLVEDGRIQRIARDISPPNDGNVVRGGGYLIPGLAEMHAHIPPVSSPHLERYLTLYLSQGITVIRGMLGEPGHLRLREQAAEGSIFAPRIVTTGPSFNGRSVTSPDQARSMVREQKAAGYDMLKIHPGLTKAEIEAVAEAAAQADIPFVGHVTYDPGLQRVLELGQSTVDHLDDYVRALIPPDNDASRGDQAFFGINLGALADLDRIPEVARWTRSANAWVVPTEALMVNYGGPATLEDLNQFPGLDFVPAATLAQWRQAKTRFLGSPDYDPAMVKRFLEVRRALISGLHDAGVGVLLGSDAPQVFNVPGFSMHQELEIYVDAGLSTWAALATGTTNVAGYLGDSDRGNVAEGYVADVVLLADNPIENISATRNIRGVMIGGRWHDRADLDARLEPFRQTSAAD